MTVLTAPPTTPRTSPVLRTLLLVDGVGTAAIGAVALAAAGPLSEHVATTTLLRATGVLFLAVGASMVLARRLSGRRLATAAVVLGEVDLLWAAATTAALVLLGASATGAALVLAVAATCVVMGTAKLRLARGLRG